MHFHTQSPNKLCLFAFRSTLKGLLEAILVASRRVRAGVTCIAEGEDVARHGVEDGLQRRPGVRAADDGAVGRLPIFRQGQAHRIA